MSFSQVLPMPSPHFGSGSDFYSSAMYPPQVAYGDISPLQQQHLMSQYPGQEASSISPSLLPSSPPFGQAHARLPHGPSRTPPVRDRDRTPIRRHRTSESRARSSSRPGALLAYATELQHQQHRQSPASGLPYRSAPSTPPYQPNEFMAPVSSTAYPARSTYYSDSMPQPLSEYETGREIFASEANASAYYPLTRTTSAHEFATLSHPEGLFLPNTILSNSPPLPSLVSSIPPFPPTSVALESSSSDSFRVLATRQRPQCWEHGCNGRQFSTFSNLLRHQREKSGSATKSICPQCGTEFTRTTARNGHMYGGKCKGKPDQGQSGSDHGSAD